MADYGCTGVRDQDGAPLNPNRLPLSPQLRESSRADAHGSRDPSSARATSMPSQPKARASLLAVCPANAFLSLTKSSRPFWVHNPGSNRMSLR
jgi:hypothetical protein